MHRGRQPYMCLSNILGVVTNKVGRSPYLPQISGEVNELVGNMTCLNTLESEFWKSEKSNQNIVMNIEFVNTA